MGRRTDGFILLPERFFERARALGPEDFLVLSMVQYVAQKFGAPAGTGPTPGTIAEFTGIPEDRVLAIFMNAKSSGVL